MRTISGIQDHLKPLDDAITNILVPAITGFGDISEVERKLLSLPVSSGGMGIDMVSENAEEEYQRSRTITAPLAAIIALQGDTLPDPEI